MIIQKGKENNVLGLGSFPLDKATSGIFKDF